MSGLETGGKDWKKRFEKMAESPFFTSSRRYLEFIGKGKQFNLVYIVMAVISLIIP
jgi:hypothetical protein